MSAERSTKLKIIDAQDLLSEVKNLTEAVYMAAASIGDRDQMSAIQAVLHVAQQRLADADTILEDLKEMAA